MFFIDSLNGWISGRANLLSVPTILRTTNGGIDWITYFPWNNIEVNSIYFINETKGWVTGYEGAIQYTDNGGVTWTNQTILQSNKIYRSIYFTDSLNGWTVGDSGTILKTTTGGILTNFTNQSTEIPNEYFLSQNYPNPFNPNTIINYQLAMFNIVTLKVYDVLGNEVATLVNERKNAGSYNVEFDASSFPSGMYFYSLSVDGSLIDTKKMVLLK